MKTLYLDIETSPNVAHVWQLWNQNISLAQLLETSRVICFAAKWDGERKTRFYHEADDRRDMVGEAWELLDSADVAVHYNGKNFDIRTLKREFAMADLAPPSPFGNIDLLQVVRREFRFSSNKLAHVAEQLGIGSKVKHEGHELWIRVLAGDRAALRRMAIYNRQDVVLVEKLYKRVLPWIGSLHPNRSLYVPKPTSGCPYCGADIEMLARYGFRYTKVGKFQRYRCAVCGGHSTSGTCLARVDIRPL